MRSKRFNPVKKESEDCDVGVDDDDGDVDGDAKVESRALQSINSPYELYYLIQASSTSTITAKRT